MAKERSPIEEADVALSATVPRRAVRHPDEPDAGAAQAPTASERYVVLDELGRGGVGLVVSAEDVATGRTVALKTLQPGSADPEALRRFEDEARLTARLEHPGIIPVYDVGALSDGTPFYTMRVVARRSLRHVLFDDAGRQEWTLARLSTVFVQVCRAVAYAHARGVLHRDLKPENILLGAFGEVYVADWGIAKASSGIAPDMQATTAPDATPFATLAGTGMGTPGYAPPEQILGDLDRVDHRSDLFALGAILYEILTGSRAFEGATVQDILYATVAASPKPPRTFSASCPLVCG